MGIEQNVAYEIRIFSADRTGPQFIQIWVLGVSTGLYQMMVMKDEMTRVWHMCSIFRMNCQVFRFRFQGKNTYQSNMYIPVCDLFDILIKILNNFFPAPFPTKFSQHFVDLGKVA